MKKTTLIIIVVLAFVLTISFLFFYKKNNSISKESSNSSFNNIGNSTNNVENILNEISNTTIPNNTIENKISSKKPATEIEISTFSTVLKGDSARLNNISITCKAINGTTINPGETFSFNKIVGQPSADKGYQEADVIINKKTEKGYGGGNCQVSTTIYNAALKVQGINIIERKPHQKKVPYIEEGKDATVSYSSKIDLKFQNNTGKTLKIYASSDNDSVDVRITEI